MIMMKRKHYIFFDPTDGKILGTGNVPATFSHQFIGHKDYILSDEPLNHQGCIVKDGKLFDPRHIVDVAVESIFVKPKADDEIMARDYGTI